MQSPEQLPGDTRSPLGKSCKHLFAHFSAQILSKKALNIWIFAVFLKVLDIKISENLHTFVSKRTPRMKCLLVRQNDRKQVIDSLASLFFINRRGKENSEILLTRLAL